MSDDKHFCPDCWDHRASAAPPRCKRPTMHQTARVVKVTVILEDSDGGKVMIETDDFEWVEMDIHRTDPPQAWDLFDTGYSLLNNDHEVGVQVHRAKTYKVYPGNRPDPTPVLEDPEVWEEPETGPGRTEGGGRSHG